MIDRIDNESSLWCLPNDEEDRTNSGNQNGDVYYSRAGSPEDLGQVVTVDLARLDAGTRTEPDQYIGQYDRNDRQEDHLPPERDPEDMVDRGTKLGHRPECGLRELTRTPRGQHGEQGDR